MPESTITTRTATVPESAAAEATFEAYGRLLKLLLPSLRGLCLEDAHGELLWASPEWSATETSGLVAQALAASGAADAHGMPAAAMRTVDADLAIYAFALTDGGGQAQGAALVALAPCGSRTEPRPLQYVAALLAPALVCLGSELGLRARLGARPPLAPRKADRVAALASATPAAAADPATGLGELAAELDALAPAAGADAFDAHLDLAMRHAQATLAALWVPERRIDRTRTRSGQALAPTALERTRHHLVAWMQLQQRTILVNRISATVSAEAAPHKILACPILRSSGRVTGVLALFNPPAAADFGAAQVAVAEAVARRLSAAIDAQYDARTGLLVRESFERRVQKLCLGGAAGETHALLYLDVDRLQSCNDSFGLHVGDEVIAAVAATLAATLPADALCAHLSGDRFVALLPATSAAAAEASADRLREALAARAITGLPPGASTPTASIGLAMLAPSTDPLGHALAAAEAACKRAKAAGGNRTESHRHLAGSEETRRGEAAIAAALRHALAENALRLDAQPILPLRGSYGGPRFELLLRLPGAQGETIAPGKFLPVARAHGLIGAIDRWVVGRACALLGRHAATVGEERAQFFVNLAHESLLDESFPEHVATQLAAHAVPEGALGFEIAESVAAVAPAAVRHTIESLASLGCHCALDGFGAGARTLADLPDLMVDTLKIDGRIVRESLVEPRAATMIKAIAQLATVMRLRTVAEHVETDALRIRLADLGVDYGQGFAMAQPQRFEELLQDLAVFEACVGPWANLPVAAGS
ncbi:MAG: GGDEF domain-containing protein [Gammaproteobacteria bacterium]|nr:GGDEF domain-containing protein [Gammaproteobacteria bacterium]